MALAPFHIGPVTLSPSYVNANWHTVTAFDPCAGRLGIGFEVPGQPVLRLAITRAHAQAIADLINVFLTGDIRLLQGDHINDEAGTQNPMSALMSSDLKSVPSEGDGQ